MDKIEIRKTDFLTPQELLMTGGSPDPVRESDGWYVPEGFSKRIVNLIE
ncbi:MAG: hypothetical protein Q7R51_02200 [bacterium]|nr:hypothetical protein [bacterium]